MKIAVVGPSHPFRGGIVHHTVGLVRHLRREHRVFFASYRRQYPAFLYPGRSDRDPSRHSAGVEADLRIDVLRPSDWLLAAQRIVAERPDAVLLPWTVPYWAPLLATLAGTARRAGIPVVFDCHNVLPHERGRFDMFAARLTLQVGNAFLVHSLTDRAVLLQLLPRVPVVQAPLPSPALAVQPPPAPVARRFLGLLDDKPLLLFFGFVRPYKGLRHLIDAVAIARESVDLHLVVAGEFWEPRATYDRQIAALGLAGNVTVVDRYIPNEDAVRYFAAADVVVLPHVQATQSSVASLALAAGRPVIATAAGGLPEAVEHGRTGLIVPPGDAHALAGAIIKCFSAGLLDQLVANTREASRQDGWSRFEQMLVQAITLGARGVASPALDR